MLSGWRPTGWKVFVIPCEQTATAAQSVRGPGSGRAGPVTRTGAGHRGSEGHHGGTERAVGAVGTSHSTSDVLAHFKAQSSRNTSLGVSYFQADHPPPTTKKISQKALSLYQ